MIKNTAFLTFVLFTGVFTGVVPSIQAQTFKAGDLVEARLFDQWLPCTVFKPVVYGAAGVRAYTVTCVINKTSGPQESDVALTDIRARAASSEDTKVAAETAAALARQPKGNGVGAKYGTR